MLRLPSSSAFFGDDPLLDPQARAQRQSAIGDYLPVASYAITDAGVEVNDPAWGSHTFTHPVFRELALHPAFRRLQLIHQLTLGPIHETIPRAGFSRWEHIWGCAVLVAKLCEQIDFSEIVSLINQLRALTHDVPHRAGSHLTDWTMQTIQGPENYHDLDIYPFFERTGLSDILRRHGFDPREILKPAGLLDLVERPSPYLCSDRLDFGLREIKRWIPDPMLFQVDVDSLVVIDNQVGFKDREVARSFALAFLLLSQEHWSEPVHRLIEILLLERVKRLFVRGAGGDIVNRLYHPYDVMLYTEVDQVFNMLEHDDFGAVLGVLMTDISHYERTYGWWERQRRIQKFMGLSEGWWGGMYPQHHPNLQITESGPVDESRLIGFKRDRLQVDLPPFKWRRVDPGVLVGDRLVPLSQLDRSLGPILRAHRAEMAKAHRASLAVVNPGVRRIIRQGLKANARDWPICLQRPPMPNELLREHIESASIMAAAYGATAYDPG